MIAPEIGRHSKRRNRDARRGLSRPGRDNGAEASATSRTIRASGPARTWPESCRKRYRDHPASAATENGTAGCVFNATLDRKGRRTLNSTARCPLSSGTMRRGDVSAYAFGGGAMFGPWRGVVIATALVLPTAAAAQLELTPSLIMQGRGPSLGPLGTVQSGDEPNGQNGHVAGAVCPVVADPLDANTLFIGTLGGGIWKTTDGGTNWKALTDKQATLSISSLAYDPTDPSRLIAGTGLTANGSVAGSLTSSGGLRNGLLYSKDGGSTWTSLGAGILANQSVVGVAARGDVIVAGTYEISGFATDRNTGALYRSPDGGATFMKISGAGTGLPDGPISSIAGDPNNPNRLYAAVTAPNASGNASTALFVSDNMGASWTQKFGAAQSDGTIQSTTQTIIKIATGPDRAVAAAVVEYLATGGSRVTGVFWSGDSGNTWTKLPLPPVTSSLNQASVNSAVAIDPKNKNFVYVSGDENATASNDTVSAFRIDVSAPPATAITSLTGNNTANGSTVHSDSRAIAFDANGRLYSHPTAQSMREQTPRTIAGYGRGSAAMCRHLKATRWLMTPLASV